MKGIRIKLSTILLYALTAACLISAESDQWKIAGERITTKWADKIDVNNVLPEYPRPQMKRDMWQNLNGLWDYAIVKKGSPKPGKFDGKILVPFAVESALSGVGKALNPSQELWYERNFELPKDWAEKSVLLHFGAVDWRADVYVNGAAVGFHTGGYTPFSFDITKLLKDGANTLTVKVFDPTDTRRIPAGKQVLKPSGCRYTAVSGIWQTVWLEAVPQLRIENLKITPNLDAGRFEVKAETNDNLSADKISVKVLEGDKIVSEAESVPGESALAHVASPKLWSPDSPFLYDLQIDLIKDGKTVDSVKSYAAMRKISIITVKGAKVFALNNNKIYMFGPLDQGWWPDGLYTAPTDEALAFDIEKTKQWGFNMIRKHIKVEPARWYYHCDRLGMLVWQDMPSCSGLHNTVWITRNFKDRDTPILPDDSAYPSDSKYTVIRQSDLANFRKEFVEVIENLYSYPCIVTWVPFNEGWGQFDTVNTVKLLRRLDSTRPINAASGGNFFQCGDILSNHNYPAPRVKVFSLDYLNAIDEYGGLGVQIDGHVWKKAKENYGYGGLRSIEEAEGLYMKYASILQELAKYGVVSAVYTQTTDVEIEVNGLMTYDRKVVKFNEDKIREANRKVVESIKDVDSIY